MSDSDKNAPGMMIKVSDGEIYFIPKKVLQGFLVNNPAGWEALDKLAKSAPARHDAYSLTVDRDWLTQALIL